MVTKWIHKNPTLFSMGIIGNVSLIYFYRNGYFVEWYNLIRNSSPRFLELANNFNNYFQEKEKNFSKLKNDQKVLRNEKKYILKEKTAIYVEEQQDFDSSKNQVEREPTLEDYTDHFQYWNLILDLNDQNNQD